MITHDQACKLIEPRCDFALKRHLVHVATSMLAMSHCLGYGEEAEK